MLHIRLMCSINGKDPSCHSRKDGKRFQQRNGIMDFSVTVENVSYQHAL